MSNPVAVKWFASSMSNAPVLSGQAGKLIDVLDACLINGFGSVTLASLVVGSGVATGTVNTGHGFVDHAVVLVAGATPSGLNGEKRIAVTGTNTFTFDATGITNQTATGTITAKMAPLGWAKTYSATNKAAYSRAAVAATAMLLRVDDTPAQFPAVRMYETMSGIDTGTGASTVQYTGKSASADSTAVAWTLFGDDQLFYLFVQSHVDGWYSSLVFGDIDPYKSADAYHCLLVGNTLQNYYYPGIGYLGGISVSYGELARGYAQTGAAVGSRRFTHAAVPNYMGDAGIVYPTPTLSGVLAWPVEAWETNVTPRGLMPGFFCPLADDATPIAHGTIFDGIPGFSGRKFFNQAIYTALQGSALIDITGPWR